MGCTIYVGAGVGQGKEMLIIEHNLEIIKVADWIIGLGTEGGDRGGEIVAEGTLDQILASSGSYTGMFLKGHINK